MALKFVRIGSMSNIHVYDDGDFSEAIETDATIKAGTAPTDPSEVLRLSDVGTLVGSVVGPAVSTDNAIVRYNGITGGLVQNSLVLIDDLGNISIPSGISIAEGANATMGTATLVAGTATVNTNKITANSRVFLTTQSLGTITRPVSVGVTARVAETSFTITSMDITDTSTVAWVIMEPG